MVTRNFLALAVITTQCNLQHTSSLSTSSHGDEASRRYYTGLAQVCCLYGQSLTHWVPLPLMMNCRLILMLSLQTGTPQTFSWFLLILQHIINSSITCMFTLRNSVQTLEMPKAWGPIGIQMTTKCSLIDVTSKGCVTVKC